MSEYKMKPGKMGESIIDTYKKIEDKFVDAFLEEDGTLKTGGMAEKRIALGIAAVVLAGLVMGITYFAAGGFPAMNLLFV